MIEKIRRSVGQVLVLPARFLTWLGLAPYTVRLVAVISFFIAGGDSLRYRLKLGKKSLVMDIGGYKGHFALEILKNHECSIWIFEAVPEFAATLSRRLGRIPGLRVFAYGLTGVDQSAVIRMDEDASSTFEGAGRSIRIKLKSIVNFLNAERPKRVDLMKMNIEGGEFELLEHLVESPWMGRIDRLQIQFHPFVPSALARMKAIQRKMERTHTMEWGFPMVWESWRLKNEA